MRTILLSDRRGWWLATLLLLSIVGLGCDRRDEIARQTLSARIRDTQGEATSSAVPTDLPTWTEVARYDPGFKEARGVACGADGRIYVAGDQAVRCLDTTGAVQWELPVHAQAGPVAVTENGVIFVGLHNRVAAFGPDGSAQGTWTPYGDHTWITDIVPTPTEVYIADAGNRRVWRFDRQGTYLGEIGRKDPNRGIPALAVPSPHLDIELAPDGTLIVVNPGRRTIQYHSLPDGALVRSWGKSSNSIEGFGGCCNPTDIAVLPDGRVVTAEKGIPRVKVYSAEGTLLSVVAPPASFDRATEGIDLAVDPQGRVVVLDPVEGMVRIYEETDGGIVETERSREEIPAIIETEDATPAVKEESN